MINISIQTNNKVVTAKNIVETNQQNICFLTAKYFNAQGTICACM